jgi:hypothetical protein
MAQSPPALPPAPRRRRFLWWRALGCLLVLCTPVLLLAGRHLLRVQQERIAWSEGLALTRHEPAEAPEMVRRQWCPRPVTEVILHHTYRPSAAQFKGARTIQAIDRVHARNHWGGIGYHYLVAPDGGVWVGRPLARTGAHVADRNGTTVGVALILDGERELPSHAQRESAGLLLGALCNRFRLDPAENFAPGSGFHRDYSTKPCPGSKISRRMVLEWIRQAAPG